MHQKLTTQDANCRLLQPPLAETVSKTCTWTNC